MNSVLVDEQHGFCIGRSTITCNMVFYSYIMNAFRHHNQVDVIYTDFTKAFDRGDHTALLNVLDEFRFSDPLLSWLIHT